MILDSSAIVAIFLKEPGHEALLAKLGGADVLGIGAATLTETGIVLSHRLRRDARPLLARFAEETGLRTLPFTHEHHIVATSAWLRFGKGRHPANLNFGDCLTYAAARVAGLPLLCVGNDFPRTDLVLA